MCCHPEDLTGGAVQTAQMLYCNGWFSRLNPPHHSIVDECLSKLMDSLGYYGQL